MKLHIHSQTSIMQFHWKSMIGSTPGSIDNELEWQWSNVVRRYSGSNNVNTLKPGQNGRHFADDVFKCIFLNENVWILINISLKFVPKGLINNIPALVLIMAWRRPGDKPLSEPMMVNSLTHICVTRPQWVNVKHIKSVPLHHDNATWHNNLVLYKRLPKISSNKRRPGKLHCSCVTIINQNGPHRGPRFGGCGKLRPECYGPQQPWVIVRHI